MTITTTTTRVFVVNRLQHDYADAERFGEIVNLLTGYVNPLETMRWSEELWRQLERHAPGPEDFVLLSGPSLFCVLVAQWWVARHGKCRMLLFDAKRSRYTERLYENGGCF